MKFPILEINNNAFVNTQGIISYFYKFLPLDFEQIDYDMLCAYYSNVHNYLDSLSDKDFIRFYKINNEIYLMTTIVGIEFPNVVLIPEQEPFDFFIGESDFYSDLKIGDDYLLYNGKFHKLINIQEYPQEINENHLGELGVDFITSIRKLSEIKKKSIMESKDGTFSGKRKQSVSKLEKAKAEKALAVIENLADDLSSGQENLFLVETWIIVSDVSKNVLHEKVNNVFKSLLNHKLYLETIDLDMVFYRNFPGVLTNFSENRAKPKDTTFITLLLPLSKDQLMDTGFDVQSRSGFPLKFNSKDRQFINKNAFTAGPTGSGKSLLIQHMIDNLLKNNENVIVLDKGESYKKLCICHDGLVLENKINFLAFKSAQYLTDLVLEISGKDEFSKIQKGELFDWIKEGIKDNLFTTHAEFIDYLDSKFSKIRYYFSDILDFFTDSPCDFENHKFIYCEIKRYPPKMRGPVILFLFQFYWNFQGNVNFVFEEIHNFLLTTPDSIVGTISREIRKDGGALFTVIQSINDIELYPLLNVLWENSQHKFLFRHESEPSEIYIKGHARDLFLSLSETTFKNNNEFKSEKKNYSEFLIHSAGFQKVVRLYVSKLNYEKYTTDPEDKRNFNKWMEVNGSMFGHLRDAISSYVRIKYEV